MQSRKVFLSALGAALAVGFSLAGAAAAATFDVNRFEDEGDSNPGDGSAWATRAKGCTLRAAVEEANALGGADEIRIPVGEYRFKKGLGELRVTDDLSLRGQGLSGSAMYGTILNARRLSRVLHVDGAVRLSARNLTIRDGKADGTGEAGRGGGIFNEGGTVELDGVFLKANIAKFGGAIYNEQGVLSIFFSYIKDNRAEAKGAGGGLYNHGTAVVRNSIFKYNRTRLNKEHGGGGGCFNKGSAEFTNVTFHKNRGRRTRAGAFMNAGETDGEPGQAGEGEAHFTNCTIWHNQARQVSAGIVNESTKPCTVHNTILAGNERVTLRHNDFPGELGGNYGSETGKKLTSLGHNLDSSNKCGLTQPGDLINQDKRKFGMLALRENGGPTPTLEPKAIGRRPSVVVDAGDASGAPSTDQRGFLRPADGNNDGTKIPDIGAYEVGAENGPFPD